MREIKFQGIYRPTGEKFDAKQIDTVNKLVWGAFDGQKYDYCHYSIEPNGKGDAWLREYTGLKDKNGVEIYEGDIVSARPRSDTGTFVGYVIFVNGQYFVNYIDYESYYVPLIELHNAEYEQIEVMGNIYETENTRRD